MKNETNSPVAPLLVWWIVWFALLSGMFPLHFILGQIAAFSVPEILSYAGALPLTLSLFLRVGVLPRLTEKRKAFPLFIGGLALAEVGGLLGILLGGMHKDTLFALSLIVLAAYAPVFARKYDAPLPAGAQADSAARFD